MFVYISITFAYVKSKVVSVPSYKELNKNYGIRIFRFKF